MFRDAIMNIVLTLSVVRCSAPLRAQETNLDSKNVILAARASWNKAVAERDVDALSKLIAPDFSSVGGARSNSGMTADRNSYISLFKARPDVFYERRAISVNVIEAAQLASEEGSWTERWTEPDGATELQGSYMVMWRKLNGSWRQQAEIFIPASCKGGQYCRPKAPLEIAPLADGILNSYVGVYDLGNGSVLEVRREGDYLVGRSPETDESLLTPKGEGEFSARHGTVIRFRSSSAGLKASSVEILKGAKVVRAGQKLVAH